MLLLYIIIILYISVNFFYDNFSYYFFCFFFRNKFFDEQAGDDNDDYDEDIEAEEGFEDEYADDETLRIMKEQDARRAQENNFFRGDFSAQDIAKRYEEKVEYSKAKGSGTAAPQTLHLPTAQDPKLFKVRCKPGIEPIAIRSIMLKSLDLAKKDDYYRIKSAIFTGTKGYLYVEALSETFAKEVLFGLRNIYGTSISQIPLKDMPAILDVTVQRKPLEVNQFVRIKRGLYKGDLAQILELYGSEAKVKLVPRIDYSEKDLNLSFGSNTNAIRPPQRLLDMNLTQNVVADGYTYRNEIFNDGFLIKTFKIQTYIDDSKKAVPTVEELRFFNKSAIDLDLKENANPYIPGDLAQILTGELENLIVRIVSTDDVSGIAKVKAYNGVISDVFEIELSNLMKYVNPGSHVKVMKGQYSGQTGRVVTVTKSEVSTDPLAIILTDGLNTEISCNVSFLQITEEVATGGGHLMGYELYDLVSINETESGVVINVGVEKLKIINNSGFIKNLSPQEINSKQNNLSIKSKCFDIYQNIFKVGDTLHVVSGPNAKLTGTVKHIHKGTVWLHSNIYLKNSGIFVVKGRNCALPGGKNSTIGLPSTYGGKIIAPNVPSTAINQKANVSTVGGAPTRSDRELIGSAVKITKGAYKGLSAQIISTTSTHFTVELLARLKKVTVARDDVIIIGDKTGRYGGNGVAKTTSYNPYDSITSAIPATPFLTSQTPAYFAGSETPAIGLGSETPSSSFHSSEHEGIFTVSANETSSLPSNKSNSSNPSNSNNVVIDAVIRLKESNEEAVVTSINGNNIEVRILDSANKLTNKTKTISSPDDYTFVPPVTEDRVFIKSGLSANKEGKLCLIKANDGFVSGLDENKDSKKFIRLNYLIKLYKH